MINAKEVRIGNWVMHDKGNGFQEIMLACAEDICLVQNHPEKFETIPLTEEWLTKFGFNRTTYNDPALDIESDFNAEIYYTDDHRLFLHDCDGGKIGREIQYVHQLQNLYFALTGNELIINQ